MENRNDNNYDEPLNMNPNKSELPNQKNSTIKKIQFYVTMVIGIIFLLLVLFSFFKNILSSEKEEKVVHLHWYRSCHTADCRCYNQKKQ